MAKRGGLGQRGLDLLISASSAGAEQKEAAPQSAEDNRTKTSGRKTGTGTAKSSTKKSVTTKTAKADVKGNTKTSKKKNGTKNTVRTGTKSGNNASNAEEKAARTNRADANNINAKTNTIGAFAAATDVMSGEPLQIAIDQIEPNRSQPRKNFEEDALQELADSIRQFGVIQPLIVQKKEDYYEIIAGERRWRAARIAGLKKLPAIVKEYTPREVMEISLIENIQREDLNPIEEASAYRHLMEEYHLRQDEVAQRVSRSRAAIANSVRLLNLDQRVQDMVVSEMLTTGHARALLSIADPELQYSTAQRVFDEKMSVREVEKEVRKLLESPKPARKPAVSDILRTVYAGMEEEMKAYLGTKVTIAAKSPQKGKIEIEYYSSDDLDRLCAILKMPVSEARG